MNELYIVFTLLFLEIVLGIDNIIGISLFVSKVDEKYRDKARYIGLVLAVLARCVFVFIILYVCNLHELTRNIILLFGGLYLVYISLSELFKKKHKEKELELNKTGFLKAIISIIILDITFSVDSVLAAIALTKEFMVILIAVVLSFAIMIFFTKAIGNFILKYKFLNKAVLVFLFLIGLKLIYSAFF